MDSANSLEMYGQITMQFDHSGLEKLCNRFIAGYDPQRFRVVAVRLFCGKEIVLTIFVEDRLKESAAIPEGKFPVKKIKTELRSVAELLECAGSFNFTVANPAYNIDEMEVMNR